ncbi:MAG: glycosyltransferase [bacterium]
MPQVVVAILSWNRARLLESCLESLFEHTRYPGARICVLDQGSEDETGEVLKRCGAKLDWVHTAENLGFVQGNNLIFRRHPRSDVVLLNNDTLVTEGWLEALIDCAYSDPAIAVVGARLLYPDGRLQEAGSEVFSDGSGWNVGKGDLADLKPYGRRREVDYCSGACLYVKRSLLEATGGLDERFSPAYYEDTDLCFSARRLGLKVVYEPKCRVFHLEGGTAGVAVSAGAKKYQVVNREKFVEKWRDRLPLQRRSYWESPVPAGAEQKEKILVVARTPPMFDKASGELRLFQMLGLLARHCNVVFLACDASGAGRYVEALRDLGIAVYGNDVARFPHIEECQGLPAVDVEKLLAHNRFRVALLEFHHMTGLYADLIRRVSPATVLVTDSVDVHFVREMREARMRGDGWMLRRALENRRSELARYERSDVVLTVTEDDRRHLLEASPSLDVRVVPNIHTIPAEVAPRGARSGLLFIGGFSHPPNADAVLFFLDEVYPLVKAEVPEATLRIVGNAPPPEVLAHQSEDVEVVGYVPDTAPYLDAALVSIAPLRYGAGMKGKVGEAMAAGLPVVTTSIGAEGLGASSGEHLLVADAPAELAAAISSLCRDAALWERISRRGRRFIQETYSPQAVERRMVELLSTLPVPRARASARFVLARGSWEEVACVCPLSKVTVAIASCDRREPLERCIEALQRSSDCLHEIVVVDDGSSDGTAEWLERTQIRHIRNERRCGFDLACAQALAAISSEFAAFLRPDTVVTPHWDARLMELFRANPGLGAVSPASSVPGSCETVYDLEELAWEAYEKSRGRLEPVEDLAQHPCVLVPMREVGPHGAGNEDPAGAEAGLRARLKRIRGSGRTLAVAGSVLIYHEPEHRRRPARASRARAASCPVSLIVAGGSSREDLVRLIDSAGRQSAAPRALELVLPDAGCEEALRRHAREHVPRARVRSLGRGPGAVPDAIEKAHGEYVVLIQPGAFLDPDFLERHLEVHKVSPSEDLLVTGNTEAPDGSGTPLLEFLSSLPTHKGLGLSFSPYYATNVSARGRLLRRFRLRPDLSFSWQIRELAYRASLDGVQVLPSGRAVTRPCAAPSLEALCAEQRRAGREAAGLARKHPNRIWGYRDLQAGVVKDFLDRERLVRTVDEVRRDLERDASEEETAAAARALLFRMYATLLNYHYAWGVHEAISQVEGDDWCDLFLREEHPAAGDVRGRIRAENEMHRLLALAAARAARSDWCAASDLARAAGDVLPDSPVPHACLGAHSLNGCRWQAAEQAFETSKERQAKSLAYAREVVPVADEPSRALQHALSLMFQGRHEAAARLLRSELDGRRVERAGQERLFRFYLGRCCERAGHLEEAARAYEEALEWSFCAEANHRLLMVYMGLGRRADAARALERSVLSLPEELSLEPARDGRVTVRVRRGGRSLLLHSGHKPLEEAERSLPGREELHDRIIVQLGVGLGYPLEAVWKRAPRGTPLVAVEREAALFDLALAHHLGLEALTAAGLRVLAGERDAAELEETLGEMVRLHPGRRVLVIRHAPSFLLHPDYYQGLTARLTDPPGSREPVRLEANLHV